MTPRPLDTRTFVAGQIRPEDVPGLAAAGIGTIVNNRPDGEEPGQPAAAEIEAAASAAGIGYCHIPVASALTPDRVEAMAALLQETEGKVLAFCRSGTRSAFLWALAEASRGADTAVLVEQAAAAGYDLSPIRGRLR